MEWRLSMSNTVFVQRNPDSPSQQGRPGERDDGSDSDHSNWTSQGMRQSGRHCDEIDNGKEIAYFPDAHQERDQAE
jgi:hypothetical protein